MAGRRPGSAIITIDVGAWSEMLAACYDNGWILVEMDEDERPVRAFCNTAAES